MINDAQTQLRELESRELMLIEAMNQTLKESLDVFKSFVDPLDRYRNGEELWDVVGADRDRSHHVYHDENGLKACRDIGRELDVRNEFAISGRENRTSYVYGWGFTYTVTARRGASPSKRTIRKVQDVIDEFLKANKWSLKSQENNQRSDRDGEVILRKFAPKDGILRVRYVEPEDLQSPSNAKENETFGIRTDPDDIETVTDYYIASEGDWVPAKEIIHRKRNADSSMKRGVPTFYPVEPNLKRAKKLQRNMSALSQIQTAIAMIRRMVKATDSTVNKFVRGQQQATAGIPTGTGGTGADGIPHVQRFEPGTILNANGGVEYEFPSMGVDPSKYAYAFESEIRSAAARIVMPEFMLASNANNAHYASLMAAEGPAVKNFQRIQWAEVMAEQELMEDVLEVAVAAGLLKESEVDQIVIQIEGPDIAVRDQLQSAQVAQILTGLSLLSPQTASAWFGLEYEQEQSNIEDHAEASGGVPGMSAGNAPELPESEPDPEDEAPEEADDENPDGEEET